MSEKKKTVPKKPAAAPPKKAAAKKPGKKGGKKKDEDMEGIKRATAEARQTQEEGSIAPPTTQLVDAFAKYRSQRPQARAATSAPAVKRLEKGAKPPWALQPPRVAPAAPIPTTAAPVLAPAPEAKAALAAPAPEAPAEAQPEAEAPAASATASESPAAPAAPAAPELRPEPGKAKSAIPEPKATYRLEPAPVPSRPGAGLRPSVPGSRPGPKPAAKATPKAAPAKPAARPEDRSPEPGAPPAAPALKPLAVSSTVTVRELAEKMSISSNELIKKLISQGVFATINQRLDSETAILMAHDYGFELEVKPLHMEEEIVAEQKAEDKPEDLQPRPPVVTVMGHVDHGKTSLLDAIRQADVVSGESGGITQHIGAYQVRTPKGELTFLDTPGHAAFTAMRSRGAKVTDIVILVVSAADGVQPQTEEAIDHAKEAGVPIIVAVNKIDLPQANPQKIRQDLSTRGLLPEEWGGKTIFVDISAKKRQGLEKLLELVLLQAEMLELKANPTRSAAGAVIEAQMDRKRGAVATVLVQKGTLRVGDSFVMGLAGGKVKALVNDRGERVREAGPSTPVEVLGIAGSIPQAGDSFMAVADERMAKDITAKRNRIAREEELAHRQHVSLLNLREGGAAKGLRVVLKADVQGSIEVLKDSLEKLSTQEIGVRVIHAGLGAANESDVQLATASDAIILLFHVGAEGRAKELAEKEGVELRSYEVIYELTADVRAALEGLLEPEEVEVKIGVAEIKAEFKIRGTRVAGCLVLDGKAVRGGFVRVLRGAEKAGEGRIEVLKHLKDDAKEIEKGKECGMTLAGCEGWQVGDRLEVLVKEKRVRRLETSA